MNQRFRVKILPPCKDCHYVYAKSLKKADRKVTRLKRELKGCGCVFFVYAETSEGHIRVR